MKTSPIVLIHVDGAAPGGALIAAEELAHRALTANVLFQAKHEAEALRIQAKSALADAQHDAEFIRQQARLQGQQEAQQSVEKATLKAITSTMAWLVDEDELEQVIAHRLEKRIRGLAVRALLEFARKQDLAELLIHRLKHRVPETLQANSPLQIRVHPWNLTMVQNAFQGEKRVRVLTDNTLTSAQAVLENELILVMIDLDAHLNLLVERLLQDGQSSRGSATQHAAPAPNITMPLSTQQQQSSIQPSASALTHLHKHQKDGTHG